MNLLILKKRRLKTEYMISLGPDRPIIEQFQDASWEHRLELVHAMEDGVIANWECAL